MSNSSKANIADGEKIKQFRLGKFWSQEELADRAAIALNTLQDIEAGKRRPKFQTIQKLACVFNVDPQELTSPHCLSTQANGNIQEAPTLAETQSTTFAHSGNGKMESMPSSEEMANEECSH